MEFFMGGKSALWLEQMDLECLRSLTLKDLQTNGPNFLVSHWKVQEILVFQRAMVWIGLFSEG